MKLTEKQIETDILKWLNFQKGVFAFKINTTGIYDPTRNVFRTITNPFIHKGCSDILGIARHQMIAIEVKTPEALEKLQRKPTPHYLRQLAFLQEIRKQGGVTLVASSLGTVIDWFTLFSKG